MNKSSGLNFLLTKDSDICQNLYNMNDLYVPCHIDLLQALSWVKNV